MSQLCAGKSQIPSWKRIEGAVISSVADSDINCTITFSTKSAQQHFVLRFEELKLGCDDHLKIFDSDLNFGQQSIKDFSCRDNLASAPIMKTASSFLTIHFSTDSKTKLGDGFRLVVTAVLDVPRWDCPPDHTLCRNHLCISGSLFCDDVNHCIDNSDEASCSSKSGIAGSSSNSIFNGDLTLSNALGLLVVLVLVIFTCVIIFISAVYCRRESHYAQYQHHLQRAIGVPLQSSSSLMFSNHQPQYHYFQPANLSPYITPQHHAAISGTLPRGYSTLPLNLVRQQTIQNPNQTVVTKANNIIAGSGGNSEYLMMAGLTGPPTAAMQAAPTMQTNLYLPTSQSILATGIRYPTTQERR